DKSLHRSEMTRSAICGLTHRNKNAPLFGYIAAIRGTKRYGTWRRDHPGQSALMPTNFTTLPHFSVSSAMSLPKSAGEPASTVPPRAASRALSLGSARPALISLLSFATISAGVFLGAPRPYQLL